MRRLIGKSLVGIVIALPLTFSATAGPDASTKYFMDNQASLFDLGMARLELALAPLEFPRFSGRFDASRIQLFSLPPFVSYG